ncbi:hypothetical protein [Yeosuana sp.]
MNYYFYEVFNKHNKSLGFVFGETFSEAKYAAEVLYGNAIFLKTVNEEEL